MLGLPSVIFHRAGLPSAPLPDLSQTAFQADGPSPSSCQDSGWEMVPDLTSQEGSLGTTISAPTPLNFFGSPRRLSKWKSTSNQSLGCTWSTRPSSQGCPF